MNGEESCIANISLDVHKFKEKEVHLMKRHNLPQRKINWHAFCVPDNADLIDLIDHLMTGGPYYAQ